MKKHILTFVLMALSLTASAQALHIFHDGSSTPDVVANGGIDSIYYAPKFLGSTEYQQVLVTKDGEKRYDIVDSVKFNLPHLVAFQHYYIVPSDFSSIIVNVSYSREGAQPVLLLPDGSCGSSSGISYNGNYVEQLYYGNNYGEVKGPGTEIWYVSDGNIQDSITVVFAPLPFCNNGNLVFCLSPDEHEIIIDTNYPGIKPIFYTGNVSWYYNAEDKIVLHFSKNESDNKRRLNFTLELNGVSGGSYVRIGQHKAFMHTPEEHMAALHDLCDATNFSVWGRELNWWSDKPLWEWNLINHEKFGDYYWKINDHIVHLDINYKKISGTIPESFEVFMDDADFVDGKIDLSHNYLYGKIPSNIRHHKYWEKLGWELIQQNPWGGGGFDMEDINLRIDSVEVEDFVNETTSNTYDMLKKNKITWVFNAGMVLSFSGISDERVNKYLDYCDKGLGIITTVGEYWDETYDNYRNYIINQHVLNHLPESIIWTKGFDKADVGPLGSMSILDSEGNVLWYSFYDGGIPESFYVTLVDSVCRKYLGEPSEHEPYVSTHYKSTDYSFDGEVLTLQKATIGNGVDLVLLGDQYVDTLLVEGGQFEKDMYIAMERFFDVEPYKSLRERFNVYTVKAVSPNGYDGLEHIFYYNDDKVFEYVQKIPNVDMEHVAIAVYRYDPNFQFFISGETRMWESGTSIAYLDLGGSDSYIICHETGGHGIAKLLDEYVYDGYESNHTQEGANEEFREWIKTNYHEKGWGMNVSATDNPDEVPWAHFLKDERYKDEVGIYQGAWMWPEELWRSSKNSIMTDPNYLWFNAPSREAIYKTVMQLSEGEGWTYDYEKFVEFDLPIRDVNKRAMARRGAGNESNADQRRVELRPPTIYKGSWRDAGKSEKLTPASVPEKYSTPQTGKASLQRPVRVAQYDSEKKAIKPYYMYKGERMEVAPNGTGRP